ncbi:MAG: TIGR03667 family PPOX class F420-dependent oxidoreductase [bacterium]|nr:TIGR03667 family PPOX class F420-dependent oxidoreductase [bacterium]
MPLVIEPKFADLLSKAYYIWLTTVREDGMPQPTPVWFVQDGDSFVIYSQPDAQKVKNVKAHSKVALSFNADEEAESYVVIMGHATVDPGLPKAIDNPAYLEKYAKGIPDIGMTPESMSAAFSAAIRVLPTRIRGN